MATIIKKGTSASCFKLSDDTTIMLIPDVLTVLDDKVFDKLMMEYGSFIKPRIITESNPSGCFIVSFKKENAKAQNKEVGEVKDNSSPVEVEETEEVQVIKRRGRKKSV